jgi:Tol biopolymer transport system component
MVSCDYFAYGRAWSSLDFLLRKVVTAVVVLSVLGCVTAMKGANAAGAEQAEESTADGTAHSAAGTSDRVVFSSNRSGRWRIWCIGADGAGVRQLTEGDSDDDDVDPCFGPDGTCILFTSTRGGASAVWRMQLDGGGPERICSGDQAEWSPRGRRIVLRRQGRILLRDLARETEKVITPADWTRCSGPAWSPDGKTIAFACRWDAGNAIFTVPAIGGKPVKVYGKKGACEPHWSPDGKHLIYETETNICTIDPDGKKNRMITYFGGVQRYARWSPDGKRIVFCQGVSERGPWELYTLPSGGGTPVKLTSEGSDMYPDWK